MATVARFDGIKIQLYWDDHPPAHFHAEYGDYRAKIAIESLFDHQGLYTQCAVSEGEDMGQVAKKPTVRRLVDVPVRSSSRKDRLKKLPLIVSASPVIPGVLKIVWNDGYEGVVDLRPTIARGRIFTYLQSAKNFSKVRVSEYGHSIEWISEKGEEIDFGADTLRSKAESSAPE